MRVAFASALALIVLAFGGCAEAPGPPAAEVTTTPETGAIQGTVTDEEQKPIAGVAVAIRQAASAYQNQTVSLATGSFGFSELSPGDYQILAQTPFFEPAQLRVNVRAGEVTPATLVMKRVAAPAERIVELFPKKGFITCSVGWTITTGTFYSNPCQDILGNSATFKVPLNPALNFSEIVLEMVWQPGSPSSGTLLRMILCSEKDPTTNYYGPCVAAVGVNPYYQDAAGPPPLKMRRTDLPLKTVKNFEVNVGDGGPSTSPPRVPFTFQQSFDLYMSLCYNQNCTAEYTALPPT